MHEDISPETLGKIQHELDTSRHILKAIFDSTQSSIFLIDINYRILFFNKWAKDGTKLLYGKDLSLGDNMLDLSREDDEEVSEAFKANFQRAVMTRSTVTSDKEMHYPQMSFWLRSEYTPVYDCSKLIGVLLNAQNISHVKKLEKQTEEQHKLLADIAWSQSHETRQPVATMLGLINILDKKSLTPDNLNIIGMLLKTAQKLDDVIHKNVIRANKSVGLASFDNEV